jgi:hypothetical protein
MRLVIEKDLAFRRLNARGCQDAPDEIPDEGAEDERRTRRRRDATLVQFHNSECTLREHCLQR